LYGISNVVVVWFIVHSIKYYGVNVHIFLYREEFNILLNTLTASWEFVAADPSSTINEPGLSTLRVEYSFTSGDRADIVLVDQYSRIVAVEIEIEPEVTAMDEAGPLQAIKYRHMLEWSANRAPGDSRALLIAHKIDTVIREKCVKYGVECYEIPRERVIK